MHVDDISVGDIVTVESWKPRMSWVEANPDYGYLGAIIRVEAIDLPLLACSSVLYGNRFSLDVRKLTLRRLSDEYVRAMTGDTP